MTKVVVIGAAGRMGRAIIHCLGEGAVEGLELSGAIDLWDSPELGKDVGLLGDAAEIGVSVAADLASAAPDADVLIDFSSHQGTSGNAERIAGWGKPWVIGTTGLNDDEVNAVEAAASRIPIVMAPNMSLGVNLLFSLAHRAAESLKGRGYDVEIIERHHRRKKDAPSGTALGLGREVADGLGLDLATVSRHGREGMSDGERPPDEINFHAVRGGDFAGDHTVLFAGEGECVELSHRATSRDTFAIGALRAAAWVVNQPPGLYSMQDVLGLRPRDG